MQSNLAEQNGGPLENNRSVFLHLQRGLQENPHGLAVMCTNQPAQYFSELLPFGGNPEQLSDHDGEGVNCAAWTYSQVHHASLKLAMALRAHTPQENSVMLMLIPDGIEFCLLLWTCVIMRMTFVCIDPLILEDPFGSTKLQDSIRAVQPSVIVLPDAVGAATIDAFLEELDTLELLRISLNRLTLPGWKSLFDLVTGFHTVNEKDAESLLEAAKEDDPNRIHSIIFTSGTSGRPKGCPMHVSGMAHMLHSQSWLINEHNCHRALQQAHNSRGIAPAQTLQTWRSGGTVVMTGRGFSVDDMLDAIIRFQVTFIVLTPAMVHAVAERLLVAPFSVDSVRTIQVGGDAITKDMLLKCAKVFPNAQVCINHGMTEGGGCFTWPFFDTRPACIPYYLEEICPIGTVAPGAVVRIWDPELNRTLNRGQLGEMHVSCGSLIPGYLGGTSESSFYQDEKGSWFNTNDIAMMDQNGLIYILGRRRDMIKRNGVTMMPAALESCIEKFVGTQVSQYRMLWPWRVSSPSLI
jgi:acyl-CoA synthetase (AMP-forming)/AMP-acid ligase II